MTNTTVADFANELKRPADALLEQLHAAGVGKRSTTDVLTDSDKQQLLTYLEASHGTGAARKKITLTKKTTSEIKQADASGKARTIQVEVRKKRTFIKREDEVVPAAPAPAAEAAAPAARAPAPAPIIDAAEQARRDEEARRHAELLRRQAEEQAEKRRLREEQERAAAEQARLAAQAVEQAAQAEPAPPAVTVAASEPEAPAAAAVQAETTKAEPADVPAAAVAPSAEDEAALAREHEAKRRKALAEAEAIRAMMNAPRKVLVAKKPDEGKAAAGTTATKAKAGAAAGATLNKAGIVETVRGRNGGRRIRRELGEELGMGERRAESRCVLPYRIVQVGRAIADGAMKLGRDETRLALHELGIVFPCRQKGRLISSIQREHVDEDHGFSLDAELLLDGELLIHGLQERHAGFRSIRRLGAFKLMARWHEPATSS